MAKRRSASRGWHRAAPKTKGEREAVASRCTVRKAFLDPAHMKYPVIGKNSKGCKVDCRALDAAYGRAEQLGHPKIAAKALRIAKAKHCPWVRRHHGDR